jgi:predicted phosphodiesterase
VGKLEIDHKRILMYHGSDSTKLDKFIKSGDYHYVLTGHTHVTRDERVGLTRVLNPGAHYYGSDGTTMIFDLGKDKVDLVKL